MPGHDDIVHDAIDADTPRTAFGAIVAALARRRAEGAGPFTCLSCDNLQGNGAVLRQAVVGLARLQDAALADWIEASCSFPNSMVDSIVPATGDRERAMATDLGIADALPVTHENFRQWVIEDDFCAGRPPLEAVGVAFTDDVHPYEAMKLRLLNAGHQIIANPGELLSCETIADCMGHPAIHGLYDKVLGQEVAPFVASVPGMTPGDYIVQTATRFANPAIRDTTRRVAFDGSSRHTGFLLPVLREALSAGAPIDGLVLAEALWARMCAGTREDGSVIAPNDPHWDSLTEAALAARVDPYAWRAQPNIYGDLDGNGRFAASFDAALHSVWTHGVDATIKSYLTG